MLADQLAATECRRRALRPEDAEEFRSFIRLRFAERGERIVAAYDGRSSIETYLLVVIARAFGDWRRSVWGHWRPSTAALRLGTVAIELEWRIGHRGESFESAAAELGSRFGPRAGREELETIRRHLPERVRWRQVPAEELETRATTTTSPNEALDARERADAVRRLAPLLQETLRELPPLDRLILLLVFREGLSVRAVARSVGMDHQRVGRRLDRTLVRLRAAMETAGVDRHAALLLLEKSGDDEQGWLEAIAEPEWDNPPRRPSTGEAES